MRCVARKRALARSPHTCHRQRHRARSAPRTSPRAPRWPLRAVRHASAARASRSRPARAPRGGVPRPCRPTQLRARKGPPSPLSGPNARQTGATPRRDRSKCSKHPNYALNGAGSAVAQRRAASVGRDLQQTDSSPTRRPQAASLRREQPSPSRSLDVERHYRPLDGHTPGLRCLMVGLRRPWKKVGAGLSSRLRSADSPGNGRS